jgi:hypothetical protein
MSIIEIFKKILKSILFESKKKERIYQSDPELPKTVNQYGCYWRSLLGICETMTGEVFTVEQLKDIYTENITDDSVGIDCMVKQPNAIINMGFAYLGYNWSGYQIGVRRESEWKNYFWKSVKNKRIDGTVIGYKCAGYEHYMEGGKDGQPVFDPANGEAKILEPFEITLYQIFKG